MPPNFTNPRPNFYQSDAGFSVEVLGRTGLRYVDDKRAMFVDSEVLASPGLTIATRLGDIKQWDAPHEKETVNEDDRRRIVQNIRLALESQGFELQVDDEQSTF